MLKRSPPIPLAIKGCGCAVSRVGRGIPPLTGAAVPVTGITAQHNWFWQSIRVSGIAAQGPLCPCVTNPLINTRQSHRFAQPALKSCGSLGYRDLATYPTFISLNAELVECRTSRQRILRQREHALPSSLSRHHGRFKNSTPALSR